MRRRLRACVVVAHHKNLTYLISWLGMREVGALEPKPGLPPTTAHLSQLAGTACKDPAKAVGSCGIQRPSR